MRVLSPQLQVKKRPQRARGHHSSTPMGHRTSGRAWTIHPISEGPVQPGLALVLSVKKPARLVVPPRRVLRCIAAVVVILRLLLIDLCVIEPPAARRRIARCVGAGVGPIDV